MTINATVESYHGAIMRKRFSANAPHSEVPKYVASRRARCEGAGGTDCLFRFA
jgi:hypothetical protein